MERDNSNKEKEESKSTENTSWIGLETVTIFDLDTETNDDARPMVSRNDNGNNGTAINNENISLILSRIFNFIRYFIISCKLDCNQKEIVYNVVVEKLKTLDFLNLTDKEIFNVKNDTIYNIASIAKEFNGNNIHSHAMLSILRYRDNFIEKELIASGGFGEVYKAKHRLDDIDYAIKKIKLLENAENTENIQLCLNEVKTLAKLDHTNIVTYKAAWIEPIWESSTTATSVTSDDIDDISKLDEEDSWPSSSIQKTNQNSNKDDKYSDEMDINVLQTATNSADSEDLIFFKDSNENSNKSNDIIINIDELSGSQSTTSSKSSQSTKRYILYIQMALCEETLEYWMSNRVTQIPQPMILAILQQICSGLNYIHSQHIVHHDIKPTNIFISTSGEFRVQLGDFGLACSLQRDNHMKIGTKYYAAPEQLQGKCNPKSDIYSIGIVLMELLILMKTRAEFIHVVDQFKCGTISEIVPAERYELAHMVIKMIQEDPAKRPSSKEVLCEILKKDKDMEVNELRNENEILKQNINDRDITIEKMQKEIALLKEQLIKLTI